MYAIRSYYVLCLTFLGINMANKLLSCYLLLLVPVTKDLALEDKDLDAA